MQLGAPHHAIGHQSQHSLQAVPQIILQFVGCTDAKHSNRQSQRLSTTSITSSRLFLRFLQILGFPVQLVGLVTLPYLGVRWFVDGQSAGKDIEEAVVSAAVD
jgi:hypothetical protein